MPHLYGSDWNTQPPGAFTSRLPTVRSPSPLLDMTTTVTGLLVWGFFCQGVSAAHLSSFVSFFVRSESTRSFVPDPPQRQPSRAGAVKAGCLFGDHPRGLALTVPSTAAPSNAVGLGQQDDDQRGARVRARIYRATTLYSVGPRTRTMMQSCASVAKLRSGGPILCYGVISHGVHRVSATLYGAFFVKEFQPSGPSFFLHQFLCSISKPVSSSRPATAASRRAQELSRLVASSATTHGAWP